MKKLFNLATGAVLGLAVIAVYVAAIAAAYGWFLMIAAGIVDRAYDIGGALAFADAWALGGLVVAYRTLRANLNND